jgi:hypothetical protein
MTDSKMNHALADKLLNEAWDQESDDMNQTAKSIYACGFYAALNMCQASNIGSSQYSTDEKLIQLLRPYLHYGTSGWRRVAERCLADIRPHLNINQAGSQISPDNKANEGSCL